MPQIYLVCTTPLGTFRIPAGAGLVAIWPTTTDSGCGCKTFQPVLLPFNIRCNLLDDPAAPRRSPPGQLIIPASTAAPGTAAAAVDAANPMAVAYAMSQLIQSEVPDGGSQGCSSVNSPCRVDPVKGNLIAQIRTPAGGPADPQPLLTYHSDSLAAESFGKGWSGLFAAEVVGPYTSGGQTLAAVYRGDGSVLIYQMNADGDYLSVNSVAGANLLAHNANGSWTETQDNGLSFFYRQATPNRLTRIVNAAGSIWTMAYDANFNNTAIIDPFLRPTSFSWDSSTPANLRRITDSGGRISTYTIDPISLNFRRVTTPELCITSMNYDSMGRLIQWIDPLGNCTSFSYNSSNQVTKRISPMGEVTTYLYGPSTVARVDPMGHVTTYTINPGPSLSLGTVASITDPLGNKTGFQWQSGGTVLSAMIDPKGNITTCVYDSLTNNQSFLTSVTQPISGAYKYQPGTALVEGVFPIANFTDQNGHTTALRWDSSLNRTAMIDPFGNRTSYAYNSLGQITQITDALGNSTHARYDSVGQMIAEIDATGNRTSYAYNAFGQKIQMTDPLGNITRYQYDLMNRLLSVADPLGNRTSYAWDLDSRLESVTDPLGNVSQQRYDGDSRLISTIDPLGHRTSIAYDRASNPISVTDPLGRVTSTVYDAANRPIATINPLGNITTVGYDKASNPIRVVNALGFITTTVYDTQNRPIATIDPLGNIATAAYDLNDNIVRVVDPLGHISSTIYDALNRPVSTIDPLGHITSAAYDAANRQIKLTNALGYRTTFGFDAASRLLTVTDPLGFCTSATYDRAGRMTQVQNALGFIRTITYDADSRPVATIDPLGHINSYIYDRTSRLIATIDPLGHINTAVYDAASRLVATVNPLGFITTLGYDAADENITVEDPLGNVTTQTFDLAGRPLAITNALGFTNTLRYDAISEVLAVIDASGWRYSSTYDGAGRLIGKTDPLLNQTTYRYDAASRTTMRIDGRGLRTSYLYDADDRLVGLKYQGGTRATMTYDALSRRTLLADWTGLYTATYDPDNRLIGTVGPTSIPITYAYDAVGQRALLLQPTGSFTYVFDPVGRISSLTNPEGNSASWLYDAASRVTACHMANGTRASYTYDSANRVLCLSNLGAGGVTISSSAYQYDAANNPISRLGGPAGAVTSWTYDNTYQLLSEIRSVNNEYALTYTYGQRANRNTMQDGTTESNWLYDPANQLTVESPTSGSPTTYVYDGCGNLLQSLNPALTFTCTWDGENRLVKAALSTGVVDTFTFNADGQRVGRTDTTGSVNYVWDGQNVLIETNASNAIEAVHTLEPRYYGNQVSQWRSGVTSFYHFDGQGSTLSLTDAAGTATDGYAYYAFGGLVTTVGSTVNPYLYLGQKGYIYDSDLGNYQVRARRYGTGIGRWWSRDPIGFAGGDANLYRYVGNSPVASTDPSGEQNPLEPPLTSIPKPFDDSFCRGLSPPGGFNAHGFFYDQLNRKLPSQFSILHPFAPQTDWEGVAKGGCIGIARVRLQMKNFVEEEPIKCFPDWQSMRGAMSRLSASDQARTRVFAMQTTADLTLFFQDPNNVDIGRLVSAVKGPPARYNIATLHGSTNGSPVLWEYGNQNPGPLSTQQVFHELSLPKTLHGIKASTVYCLATVPKVVPGLTPPPVVPLPPAPPGG
jgi:RHS repeat-associated protein